MIIAELPIEEELRLLDLASYEILDTESESDFNELVELAANICDCPISLIALIDKDRQWFKAKQGTTSTGTARDIAFCAHAILQDGLLQVENTHEDIRFIDNPLVTGEENIRFYAGAPILSPDGYKLGTICVIDHVPKKLTQQQEKALTILSNQVTKLLELRKKNLLIQRRAAEIIGLKKNAIDQVINKQEDEKISIAFNLQEDIAQRLSSIMLYLSMSKANETKRLEYIQTASDQVNELLSSVRNLSYSIAPYATKWISTEVLIKEYIERIADAFPFAIQLKSIEGKTQSTGKNALVAIRIIELWLNFLVDKKDISLLKITVTSADDLKIEIENNGPLIHFEEMRKHVFESSIYERAAGNDAVIDISVSAEGYNVFTAIFSKQ